VGLLFNFIKPEPVVNKVDAAVAPYNIPEIANPFTFGTGSPFITRQQAMQVPAVARARNIICTTIGTLNLEVRRESNNSKVTTPPFIRQPDPRMPASVVLTWLAEDLLFYGAAYLRILELDTAGRPLSAEWIAQNRITKNLDAKGFTINSYNVDGTRAPNAGLGSLIPFTGLDEGVLNRAGTTILAALALEKAVKRYADEPLPQAILKSNLPLPKERVTALLDAWKTARNTRSTAFINDTVEFEHFGFNPAELTLNEARQYMATEIARLMNIPEWYVAGNSSGSMTYSNVTTERRALVDFSLRPIMTAIEQRLSDIDITPRGSFVRFDLDDFYRGNPLERAEIYTKLVPLGIMTVDEARVMEDLIDNGN
jgi:HK97 family phage portal protein